MTTLPNFRSPAVLLDHARHTMRFYHPRAIDPAGGLYHFFKDDGSVYDAQHRHLVSSTRFVFTYAMAYRHFQDPAYLEGLKHAVRFVREAHRAPDGDGYAWMLNDGRIEDGTQHCYGEAFVLLAYAHAHMAGMEEARAWIGEAFDLMEKRFWNQEAGLYADEASQDWSVLSTYRGQNANMHACEALQAAYQATGERRFLERAYLVAYNITQRQAQRCGGLIWEHYDAEWQPDWKFNIDDPENLFRPWGYQPGHFTEWAKLLVQLEERAEGVLEHDLAWLLPTAERLFTVAVEKGWDPEHGGLCYSLAPSLEICDFHKYFWVQAESAAAAAMLAKRTGNEKYWEWYDRLWAYSWTHFVDHEYGAWFRILDRENRKLSDEKSPAGKVDYHTMGACYDIVAVLNKAPLMLCAGEALTDMIDQGDERWVSRVGGSTWNVARALAALGERTAFAGAISQDRFGDAIWAASEAVGLDLRTLQRVERSPLLAIVEKTEPPSYFFVGDDSADLHFDPAALPAGWADALRWAHFGGISLAREPLASNLVALARQLKARGVKISYDPNYRNLMDERYTPTLQAMAQLADVIKVSDDDLRGLFPGTEPEQALAQLRAMNPAAYYLLTRGGDGASLLLGDARSDARAPKVEVVDTVGAGDASAAGLLHSLSNHPDRPLQAHLHAALAAGSAACLQSGATPPPLAAMQRLFEQLQGDLT